MTQHMFVQKCSSFIGGKYLNIQLNKIVALRVQQTCKIVCLCNDVCFSAMRVIGPIMLVVGLALVVSGVAVCIHYRKQLPVPVPFYVN